MDFSPIVPLDTVVRPYGKVVAVCMRAGEERYYMLRDKHGTIALMPATLIESMTDKRMPWPEPTGVSQILP
jgi:hypothetical protein